MTEWIRRLLAPRWQHPKAQVRRQAAARLNPARREDLKRLEALAVDDDATVRQAALARLDDPARLMPLLAERHDNPELRSRLAALLVGQAGEASLALRITLVERLADPRLLSEIALHGDNQQLRLVALERIDDEAILIHQACENGIAAVRQAAARRVESEEGLQRLARRARRDKQVARLAREALNRQRADAARSAEAREARERLLAALERHGQQPWEPLYAGRYRHLKREWEALRDLPSAEQERRFQHASLRCRKTITDHEAHRHAHQAADRRREDADQARQGLIEALEESLSALHRDERLNAQDIASLRAQQRLLASRWQALSDDHPPEEGLRRRYDEAQADYERIGRAWERLSGQAPALEQALEQDDRQRLATLLEACDWPDDLPPTPLIERARRHLDQAGVAPADAAPTVARLEGDLEELERLLERGAFKGASRLHQSLRQRLERLPDDERRRLSPPLKRLGAQLAELRDWRGFVAGPKRDRLCEAIDELAADQTLGEAELDRRHRQLVKEWKALGDAAADRELSQRFRAASDRIHERLGPWREALADERARHLKARQALCEQLEALLEAPDREADPDALREIRDRAREQWRRHSPVPRDQAEAIGRRFGRVRHGLQALIDRRAQEIAVAKRELIDAARALGASPDSAARRAEQAKALQQRWRALGRAPKGEEQTLWQEFRAECDHIFASREAQRDGHAQRNRERLEAMQALIDRLDAWHPDTTRDTARLDQAIAEAEALEPLPAGRRADGMRRRWAGILRARRERLARLAVCEEVERWQGLQALLGAHLEADRAALADEPWTAVPAEDALEGDMHEAHERRNAARARRSASDPVEETLTRLRVHLALLAGGRVPAKDDPLRLAIQVERLNGGMGRELSLADELHEVLREILATGPVPPALWQREAPELDALLKELLRLPPN